MASSASGRQRSSAAARPAQEDARRKELLDFFSKQVAVLRNTAALLSGGGAAKKKQKASSIKFPFMALQDKDVSMDKLALVATLHKTDDAVLQLVFPSSLSSFDRMLVHEVATMQVLSHESTGEGADRRIVVTLELPKAAPPLPAAAPAVPEELPMPAVVSRFGELAVHETVDDVLASTQAGAEAAHAPVEVSVIPQSEDAPVADSDDLNTEMEALDEADDAEHDTSAAEIAEPIVSAPVQPLPPVILVTPGTRNSLLGNLAAERAARAAAAASARPPPPAATARPPPANASTLSALGLGGSGKASSKKSKPVDKTKYLGVPMTAVKPLPGTAAAASLTDAEDPDLALLDAIIADSRVCAATGCKKSILTLQ